MDATSGSEKIGSFTDCHGQGARSWVDGHPL